MKLPKIKLPKIKLPKMKLPQVRIISKGIISKARRRLPKLGKTARWILTAGIIAIIIIVLGVTYAQKGSEQSRLSSDIDSAWAQRSYLIALWQHRIADYNEEKEGLEAELSQAYSELESAVERLDEVVQEEFPYNSTESIEIGDALFQAADDTGVTIRSYSCSLPSEQTLNGVRYRVYSIGLSVQGPVPNLLDFNEEVSERFHDCDFKSVSIDMPAGEGGVASMSFSLGIYCYG